MVSTLTWALVIPTYQREFMLWRCLQLAANQTFPAKQIIVIDGSPNWLEVKTRVSHKLANHYPHIEWHYLPAQRLSSASQRNQGIALVDADVVFLIDDDSLMYPDCAEEVMRVYAQDTERKVAGVMPFLDPLPPDMPQEKMSITTPKDRFFKWLRIVKVKLRAVAKRLIKDDDIFIPYHFTFPKYTLPSTLKELAVHTVPMFHGARMTFRREILEQIQFEETLERYAVNEDNDVCYRASLHGMLLHAVKAHICHLEIGHARLSRFTTTALWGLNQAVLHRFHSTNLQRFERLFSKLLWQRLFTQTVKDILDLRWTLPSTRGVWFALRHYKAILASEPEALRHWYPTLQQTLISRDSAAHTTES
jgi:GT2 family glycosyltransferase